MKEFKCPDPNCGSTKLEELMLNCTVTSEILAFDENGVMEYGTMYANLDDAGEIIYQCLECGYPLPVENCEELCKWIEENC